MPFHKKIKKLNKKNQKKIGKGVGKAKKFVKKTSKSVKKKAKKEFEAGFKRGMVNKILRNPKKEFKGGFKKAKKSGHKIKKSGHKIKKSGHKIKKSETGKLLGSNIISKKTKKLAKVSISKTISGGHNFGSGAKTFKDELQQQFEGFARQSKKSGVVVIKHSSINKKQAKHKIQERSKSLRQDKENPFFGKSSRIGRPQ